MVCAQWIECNNYDKTQSPIPCMDLFSFSYDIIENVKKAEILGSSLPKQKGITNEQKKTI